MQIVRKKESRPFIGGDNFKSIEYDTKDKELNIAHVSINGRVPEKGVMRNTKVKEIVYVASGKGSVTINNKKEEISEGDVIFYEKNERVFWEGKLDLIIACTPAWSLEQHVTEE